MKKSLLLLPLAALLLAGCNSGGGGGGKKTSTGDPTTSAAPVDSEVAKRAIESAKMYKLAVVNGATTIYADTPVNIGHDKEYYHNDYVAITTSQLITDEPTGQDVTVNIEWEFDDKATFVKQVLDIDETHKGIYFMYDSAEHDFPFKAVLKCGEESAEMNFSVHLMTKNLTFDNYTLEQIYQTTSGNDNFELVNPDTGYYKPNNEGFTFTCVSTYGRVVYVSPDGNWGLIADGDYILELYSGSNLDLNTTRYPALVPGKTVYVEAELGCYKGNLQVSYIFDISSADDSKAAASTGYRALAAADYVGKHYWENKLMNSLRQVNAKYAGNIMQNNKAVTDLANLKNDRFTFDVTLGSDTLTIAYDYHVDRKGELGIFNAYKAKLAALTSGADVVVKGTLRFAGPVDKSYKGNETATTWNLVPYEEAGIA